MAKSIALKNVERVVKYANRIEGVYAEVERHDSDLHSEGEYYKLWLHVCPEIDDGVEPAGFFFTDGLTFQWRNIWTKTPNGTAVQGSTEANKMIKKTLAPSITADYV